MDYPFGIADQDPRKMIDLDEASVRLMAQIDPVVRALLEIELAKSALIPNQKRLLF